ncbi:MAG: hypothetical protein U0271_00975 [Polyangiaceae bacterium]
MSNDDRERAGGPRARTLRKMGVLLGSAIVQAACNDGYGVVDPMPPPARCQPVVAGLTGRARFAKNEAGAVELVIRIERPKDFTIVQDTKAEFGVPATLRFDDESIELRVAVKPESNTTTGHLPFSCAEGKSSLDITVAWTFDDVNTGREIKPTLSAGYQY